MFVSFRVWQKLPLKAGFEETTMSAEDFASTWALVSVQTARQGWDLHELHTKGITTQMGFISSDHQGSGIRSITSICKNTMLLVSSLPWKPFGLSATVRILYQLQYMRTLSATVRTLYQLQWEYCINYNENIVSTTVRILYQLQWEYCINYSENTISYRENNVSTTVKTLSTTVRILYQLQWE